MSSSAPSLFPEHVRVIEVGPRDGFQMEKVFIPTELKVEVVEQLARSGLREIEAVSFVHPRVIPQMRDAREVMDRIVREPGVRYWALVPNLEGAERALTAGADGVHVVVCATESYNQRNVGMSVAESIDGVGAIVSRASEENVSVAATLAATFGCPFEGQLSNERLTKLARRLADTGITELGLADSAGLGHPLLVRSVILDIWKVLPNLPLRIHLHNTRGLGLANAVAALELGVTAFDCSLGGLGGCPVIEGASGNIPTEDFVNLCDESGVATGVSVEQVRGASRRLQEFLQRQLPSAVLRSGTRAELFAANA